MLDKLDHKLLKAIEENPGATTADIIRPFLNERSPSALRARIYDLERHRLIRAEKERAYVRCYPVERET
jgi:DNA-binding Lrp family transcriptional regulator